MKLAWSLLQVEVFMTQPCSTLTIFLKPMIIQCEQIPLYKIIFKIINYNQNNSRHTHGKIVMVAEPSLEQKMKIGLLNQILGILA